MASRNHEKGKNTDRPTALVKKIEQTHHLYSVTFSQSALCSSISDNLTAKIPERSSEQARRAEMLTKIPRFIVTLHGE